MGAAVARKCRMRPQAGFEAGRIELAIAAAEQSILDVLFQLRVQEGGRVAVDERAARGRLGVVLALVRPGEAGIGLAGGSRGQQAVPVAAVAKQCQHVANGRLVDRAEDGVEPACGRLLVARMRSGRRAGASVRHDSWSRWPPSERMIPTWVCFSRGSAHPLKHRPMHVRARTTHALAVDSCLGTDGRGITASGVPGNVSLGAASGHWPARFCAIRERRTMSAVQAGGSWRREPTIEGMDAEESILRNADPIWLHQNEMWEYMP